MNICLAEIRSVASLLCLLVAGCGGGGGGSGTAAGAGAPPASDNAPRINASVMTFQVENIPPPVLAAGGNSLIVVNVIDPQAGSPITTATVTVNGTSLRYVDSLKAYRGWLVLSTGDSVTLLASVDQTAYRVVGSVPPSYPQIQSPRTPTVNTLMEDFDRSSDAFVSWNGELPDGSFHYAVAVLDETGELVWPQSRSLEGAVSGKSATIPAASIPSNFPYIAAGSAQSSPIANAATGSTLTMGAFSGSRIAAPPTEPAMTLMSLRISPSPVSLRTSMQFQLAATGQFLDRSTRTYFQDLTSRVQWTSSAPGIVTVNATGQLTAISIGAATVTAQSGGVSATQAVTVVEPGALPVDSDAYAYQINATHSGSTMFASPLVFPTSAAWTATFPDAVSYPIITETSIFVLASQGQSAGSSGVSMYAFNAATGAPRWGPVVLTTNPGANFAYDQGILVTVNSNCKMQGFDAATGSAHWSVDLSNPEVSSCGSVPTAYRGIAYAVGSGIESTVFAVDVKTGKILWGTKIIGSGTAPTVSDDGVYVTGYLQAYKLDPYSGALVWHYVGPGFGGGELTGALFGNRLYMRGFAGTPNLVFDSQTSRINGTFKASAIPAFQSTAGYFLDSSHTLAGVRLGDSAGLWAVADPGSIVSAPIVINNAVFTGTASGLVSAYDASSGAPLWSRSVGAPFRAADEVNLSVPVTGMSAGHGLLATASFNVLSVYRMTSP